MSNFENSIFEQELFEIGEDRIEKYEDDNIVTGGLYQFNTNIYLYIGIRYIFSQEHSKSGTKNYYAYLCLCGKTKKLYGKLFTEECIRLA